MRARCSEQHTLHTCVLPTCCLPALFVAELSPGRLPEHQYYSSSFTDEASGAELSLLLWRGCTLTGQRVLLGA